MQLGKISIESMLCHVSWSLIRISVFFHYVEPPGENWFENGHNNNYAKSHSETHLYLHDDLYTQF